MIPKKIHYCWLSGDPFPEKIQMCMDSWKKVMPDYEWKLWNTESFLLFRFRPLFFMEREPVIMPFFQNAA